MPIFGVFSDLRPRVTYLFRSQKPSSNGDLSSTCPVNSKQIGHGVTKHIKVMSNPGFFTKFESWSTTKSY